MSFGFRLTVFIGPTDTLLDETGVASHDFGPPVGAIQIRGPLDDLPGRRPLMQFTGRAYAMREQAQRAGDLLKDGLRVAAAKLRISLDVGEDQVLGGAGQGVIDEMAEQGIVMLPDVHGLVVFAELDPLGEILTLRGSAIGKVPRSITELLDTTSAHVADGMELSDRQRLAVDLFAQSRMETSGRSRILTLVTALEVLSPRAPRTGRAMEVVRKLQQLVDDEIAAARADGAGPDELSQLDSLRGAATDLATESISSALRNRVAALATDDAEEAAFRKQASTIYTARSQLIHGGKTSLNLSSLLGVMEGWVAEASTADQKPGSS